MQWFSVTSLLIGLCTAYIGHTVWTMYHLFYIPRCVAKPSEPDKCISSWLFVKKPDQSYVHEKFALIVYGSATRKFTPKAEIYSNMSFDIFSSHDVPLNVSLPKKSFKTGEYFVRMCVVPPDVKPLSDDIRVSCADSALTQLSVPQLEAFKLMGGADNATKSKAKVSQKRVPHWRSRVTLSMMTDDISVERMATPGEMHPYIYNRIDRATWSFMPIVLVDDFSFRTKDLKEIEKSKKVMPLTLVYKPMSLGKFRLWTNFEKSFEMLKQFGFGEKEIDEVKGIFSDTNFNFLIMTFIVSALHILFDTLAFKNDISYWKNRKTMVGLSRRAVAWRCISTIIILFYLIDSDTSLLVSVPMAISVVIELWKLKKAFKITLHLSRTPITFGETSDKEKETEQFDATAMTYLSYILYPLLLGGAVYSLLYTPHKSWYSWCLQSLVNGVYAFGFLFMLPQLFVNYKLKSVAHLPWRAFMYKAFNTFIDDIFAFIITMPTAHRVACFRDDLVFIIYLYQRWLYPVDKTRVNEYGQSFEDDSPPAEGSDVKQKTE